VKDLAAPADDKVIYNFHCYEPMEFTHQCAPWVDFLPQDKHVSFEECGACPDYFEGLFASAFEAAEKNNTILYCGEYGVIDRARPEDAVKWLQAINAVFEKHGVARALWSYKRMDFGIGDPRMDEVRQEALKYL
jgi:hypothetical protein